MEESTSTCRGKAAQARDGAERFTPPNLPKCEARIAPRRRSFLYVRGHKEKGSISTLMELAINNQTDLFSPAIDAFNRIPGLQQVGTRTLKEELACSLYTIGF